MLTVLSAVEIARNSIYAALGLIQPLKTETQLSCDSLVEVMRTVRRSQNELAQSKHKFKPVLRAEYYCLSATPVSSYTYMQ